MKTVDISLNSIDKVKSFVNDISKFDSDFDLVSGRYVIDAKSIMGIFSLDLSKPITLNIHADNANLDTIMEVLSAYTCLLYTSGIFLHIGIAVIDLCCLIRLSKEKSGSKLTVCAIRYLFQIPWHILFVKFRIFLIIVN